MERPEREYSGLCAHAQHSACIGIDIGCKCPCHVSIKTLRNEKKRAVAAASVSIKNGEWPNNAGKTEIRAS